MVDDDSIMGNFKNMVGCYVEEVRTQEISDIIMAIVILSFKHYKN